MENNYYEEIEHVIKRYEVNKKAREISTNFEQVETNCSIGKLIVEAQGGEKRAKYGNQIIKDWSIKLTKLYGKGYSSTNLKRFCQFYLLFKKGAPLVNQLSWTHLIALLPIENESKRNYYINLCIKNNLSKRALIEEIKSNSYERLIDKPKNIEIINNKNNLNITSNMHNPIVLHLNKNDKVTCEKDLELLILSKLTSFFNQLGQGFALIGNQYKIHHENKDFYIDLLLFNYKLNLFVVVELKTRELQKNDKGQVELYMKLVDEQVKEPFHNKTVGIIITKEQDEFIANFVNNGNKIISLTYKLQKEGTKNE